jgi:4-hydroxy-2-oxoheptanedioate aldolase
VAGIGFDWVCIDAQHGLIGYQEMLGMLQAVAVKGVPALVRVPWNEPGWIMKALDAGAAGVIVPMVNSPEEARAAAGACRYPPQGYRSWGPTRASLGVADYAPELANRSVVCAVMVETAPALEQLDEILAVPGVDAVFMGPSDFAISMGLAPRSDDPEHRRRLDGMPAVCRRHGVVAGIACASAELEHHHLARPHRSFGQHVPGYGGADDRFPAGSARARLPMCCRSAGQMKDRVRVLRLLRQCLDCLWSWESE